MTEYSRQAFKNWLAEMPLGEKFCDGKCPIQVFMGNDLDLFHAHDMDIDFADEIDEIGLNDHGWGHGWKFVTPDQCLQIISQLEADEKGPG